VWGLKYFVRDCENCNGLNDISNPQCYACIKPTPDLDLVIYKNKVFTKHHFIQEHNYAIYPFFTDVLMKPVRGNTLSTYDIKDAHVSIVQTKDALQPTYVIKIPGLNKTFDDLMKLKNDFDKRDFSDQLLNIWIKKHGILDYLLTDPKIQEININPPEFQTPFMVVHDEFAECLTNIYPSIDFLNYVATYLKIESGRPLNKAQPQMDGELFVENQRARVGAVIPPFSVNGIGYSIRKHREKPWTMPLFLINNTIDPVFSGLLSFAIAHGRSFLVAGARGSGKTALLGALMLEILPKYRIITIEDTQELAINYYKSIGYDLLALKVRSALMTEGLEIPFDQGLRTSLRLGDSCLILGEIRSKEAKVLYEAMRVGAMSMTVGGTIHADSPYGVYDRVVNDLDVPKGSFKVTDLIVIVNQIKSATGLHRVRRVIRVTEVLKDWEDEPKFQDLLVYDPQKDVLVPTKELLEGQSVLLKEIVSRAKGYPDYDSALRDIMLRGWVKQQQVEIMGKNKRLLEGDYNLKVNMIFAKMFDQYTPLEKPENEDKFRHEFVAELKKLAEKNAAAE
jgi:type IV secretory pathway ATPase VirB11/archaellum biosynthesis ATPase